MSALSIEELRRAKEQLEREREELEKRILEAERLERENAARSLLPQVLELSARIDALKEERQQALLRIRDAAPRLGDFSYGQEDYRLSLTAARGGMKQPELFDRLTSALKEGGFHLEPRHPRFRVFRSLRPVGSVQFSSRRMVLTASEPILDGTILQAAKELDASFPGLAVMELASARKERRVRPEVPGRLPEGDYGLSLTFAATDTGSLDAVLPLALRAWDHVAAYWERWTPDDEARLFEPWPVEAPSNDETATAPVEEQPAPAAAGEG